MRKWPLVLVIAFFGLWFLTKGQNWLDSAPPETFSTPIAQPEGPGELLPVTLPRGGRSCTTGIAYGPGARYVVLTVTTPGGRPAGPLLVEVSAPPDYYAKAKVPAGTPDNGQVVVPIDPAPRDLPGGIVCVANQGRERVGLYGIPGQANPSVTTVDEVEQAQDLSVTLLTSPSKALRSRLGTLFDHAAAFNPLSGWFVWVLFVLALVGAPLAVGVAIGRALADDEAGAQPPDSARE